MADKITKLDSETIKIETTTERFERKEDLEQLKINLEEQLSVVNGKLAKFK